MASSSAILSPSIPLQLHLWKSEKALVMRPRWARNGKRKGKGMRITCQAMTALIDDKVSDMGKRQLMNLMLPGTISLPIAGMVIPYASFFVPHGCKYTIIATLKEKENLCLYGLPNETWEVNLPVEEVPPQLPDPTLGVNHARDGIQKKDCLSLVADAIVKQIFILEQVALFPCCFSCNRGIECLIHTENYLYCERRFTFCPVKFHKRSGSFAAVSASRKNLLREQNNQTGSSCNKIIVGVSQSYNSSEIKEALKEGFEVKYEVDNEYCNGCTGSGGVCGYESMKPTCYCENQSYGNGTCITSVQPPAQTPAPAMNTLHHGPFEVKAGRCRNFDKFTGAPLLLGLNICFTEWSHCSFVLGSHYYYCSLPRPPQQLLKVLFLMEVSQATTEPLEELMEARDIMESEEDTGSLPQ
ncbi:hypothetical protein FEM48_Zijuj04G0094600 [Ziziphus jujuba var. spinosa]|uniref:PHD finger protein ALFIN-LIKE n=1 Tax=Ziziphus jujuba var. spinosa TaxID=714518 RepID=A0A978VJ33_ZIZJJ|nr:hypothetical protein FEM48_Zijuj04G0094600 [Ziziphus jujuba var. spinosa]